MHKLCTCLCGIKGPWAEGILVGCVVCVCKNYSSKHAEEKNYMVIMQQFRSKMKIPSDVLLIPYGA